MLPYLVSALIGVLLAFLTSRYGVLPPPVIAAVGRPSTSCAAPPLQHRATPRTVTCMRVTRTTPTSLRFSVSADETGAEAKLQLVQIPSHRTIAVSNVSKDVIARGLAADTDYELQLVTRQVVCRARATTRAQTRNLLRNPSFESSAESAFLATRFNGPRTAAPRQWTSFYNGVAVRQCGSVRLVEGGEVSPKSGDCMLRIGRVSGDIGYSEDGVFSGVHQGMGVEGEGAAGIVVTAWYATSGIRLRKGAVDGISMRVSYELEDGSQHDGVRIILEENSTWTAICVHVEGSVAGGTVEFIHVWFHLHDVEEGIMFVDDVSVFEPVTSEDKMILTKCRRFPRPPQGASQKDQDQHTPRLHLAARVRPQRNQLTLAVPLTPSRVLRLDSLARLYAGGPVCAAVLVNNEEEAHKFGLVWSRMAWLRTYVDVTFVRKAHGGALPINALRNVAVRLVKTHFVLMLDVDMTPARNSFDCFRDPQGRLLNQLLPPAQKRLAALPVFVADIHNRPARNKQELINQLVHSAATTYCASSQKSNRVKRWYVTPHSVETRFQLDYEPYAIARRDSYPAYDQRFSGYGFNKISWALGAEAAGWQLLVLPNSFLTHLNHVDNSWVSAINHSHYLQTWRRYIQFVSQLPAVARVPLL